MTLDQLTAFRAVARDHNFQKAADSLHLTQPAVSKQIQALERELGERLLDRGRKTRLTRAGEVLLKYAEHVAQTVEAAREEQFGYPATALLRRSGVILGLWIGYVPGDEKAVRQAVEKALLNKQKSS